MPNTLTVPLASGESITITGTPITNDTHLLALNELDKLNRLTQEAQNVFNYLKARTDALDKQVEYMLITNYGYNPNLQMPAMDRAAKLIGFIPKDPRARQTMMKAVPNEGNGECDDQDRDQRELPNPDLQEQSN